MAIADGVSRLHTAVGSECRLYAGGVAETTKLQEITAKIDQVHGLIGQVTLEHRQMPAVNPPPSLNQLSEKVLSVPAELLKPTIDVREAI